jgi:hypothetical protein
MPFAIWPPPLPTGFLAGTDEQTYENNLLTSEMDIGPAKTRRRTTAGAGEIRGTFFFTETQLSIFNTFWRTTLRSGALAFVFAGLPLRFKGQNPPKRRTVRTGEGPHYEVDVVLEVLPG